MSMDRRGFLRTLGTAGAASAFLPMVRGRGLEAATGGTLLPRAAGEIRLDSNENPYGPAPEVLRAIANWYGEAGRYPDGMIRDVRAVVGKSLGVPEDHLIFGCGSGELLKVATEAFVSADRHLVTASPTFETVQSRAASLKLPFKAPRVDGSLRLDLDAMVAVSPGAGLVFLCNPNNPTGTLHPTAVIEDATARILKAAPEAIVLIDEAYFEYVNDPGYRTMIPMALAEPRVIVARTFSKIHGMAGLRAGYVVGQRKTLDRMFPHLVGSNLNVLAAGAAITSLGVAGHAESEARKNLAAREWTAKLFTDLGYAVVPSQTNFVMVDIRRPVPAFRDACRAKGIAVGRPFPPLETHARISMGTMEEMQRAAVVFREVLG
jgi:histidinol-phosphate aminotransferase